MHRAVLVAALAVLAVTRPPAADAQVRAVPESSTCGITFSMSNSAEIEVSVRILAGSPEDDGRDDIGVVFVPAGGTATYEWRAPGPCGTYRHYGFGVGITDYGRYWTDYSRYRVEVPTQGATSAAGAETIPAFFR